MKSLCLISASVLILLSISTATVLATTTTSSSTGSVTICNAGCNQGTCNTYSFSNGTCFDTNLADSLKATCGSTPTTCTYGKFFASQDCSGSSVPFATQCDGSCTSLGSVSNPKYSYFKCTATQAQLALQCGTVCSGCSFMTPLTNFGECMSFSGGSVLLNRSFDCRAASLISYTNDCNDAVPAGVFPIGGELCRETKAIDDTQQFVSIHCAGDTTTPAPPTTTMMTSTQATTGTTVSTTSTAAPPTSTSSTAAPPTSTSGSAATTSTTGATTTTTSASYNTTSTAVPTSTTVSYNTTSTASPMTTTVTSSGTATTASTQATTGTPTNATTVTAATTVTTSTTAATTQQQSTTASSSSGAASTTTTQAAASTTTVTTTTTTAAPTTTTTTTQAPPQNVTLTATIKSWSKIGSISNLIQQLVSLSNHSLIYSQIHIVNNTDGTSVTITITGTSASQGAEVLEHLSSSQLSNIGLSSIVNASPTLSPATATPAPKKDKNIGGIVAGIISAIVALVIVGYVIKSRRDRDGTGSSSSSGDTGKIFDGTNTRYTDYSSSHEMPISGSNLNRV